MAWTELRERDEQQHAKQSGRRVTEMIRECKELMEEICEAAEEMEEEYGERENGYGERGYYGERRGRSMTSGRYMRR